VDHEVDHRDIDHGFAAIFAQSAILAEPAKRSLNNPAFGQDFEAFCVIRILDDLNRPFIQLLGLAHKLAPIAAVRPDQFQATELKTHLAQHL